MLQRYSLLGLSALLLAGCALSMPKSPINTPPTGSGSIAPDTSSGAVIEEDETSDELTFADTMLQTATGSEVTDDEPELLSGALLERSLDDGTLEVGLQSAPLILRVVTHPECRYCREFIESMVPRLMEDFVGNGKLRVQFELLPLQKYPQSMTQASAVFCAAKLGKGIPMLEVLHTLPTPDRGAILDALTGLKILTKPFQQCLGDAGTKAVVELKTAQLQTQGVSLVPTFELSDDRVTGLPSYADLRGWIESHQK